MRFRIVVVGKPRTGALADVIDDYERRAKRYWPLEVAEVREESSRGRPATLVRKGEGVRLLAQLRGETVTACAEDGEAMSSKGFATWLTKLRERAADVDFVIGGPFGLDETVLRRSTRRLALAPWTLPHDLARLVLAEQLYRAGTIVRGEPYHK